MLPRALDLCEVDDTEDESEEDVSDDIVGMESFEAVSLPTPPKVAYTSDIAQLHVGEISNYFIQNREAMQVMGLDTEYHRGQFKAKCLQICLPNGSTYVFHLASIVRRSDGEPPRSLKMLLENPDIRKVGNRVHNDVKSLLAWGINMKGAIELGHVANSRALCSKAPALDFLIELLWPGVVLEGKDGSGPRVGNWDTLNPEKIKYAALDAYAAMTAYQKLMQIMQPRQQPRILVADIEEGLPVTIYDRGWKRRIAEAVLVERSSVVGNVRVRLNLSCKDKIYAPGTFVDVIRDNQQTQREAISALLLESEREIEFDWPLHFCRRTTVEGGSDEPIKICTTLKQRRIEEEEGPSSQTDYEAEDEAEQYVNDGGDNSDSSVDENTARPRLPRSLRRRLLKLKVSWTVGMYEFVEKSSCTH